MTRRKHTDNVSSQKLRHRAYFSFGVQLKATLTRSERVRPHEPKSQAQSQAQKHKQKHLHPHNAEGLQNVRTGLLRAPLEIDITR